MEKIKTLMKKVVGMFFIYSIVGYLIHGVWALTTVGNDFLLDKNQ